MIFAQAPTLAGLTPAQLKALPPADIQAAPVDQLHALTPEQVAALNPGQLGAAHQAIETARWAAEPWYLRTLHEYLPDPVFQTMGFLVFFLAVGTLYWLLPRKWNTARVWLLVVASFHFYAAWNASLALLVTATATLDYLLARGIEAAPTRRAKRVMMWASIAMNLGILCYFKYRGFFLNDLHDLLQGFGFRPAYDKLTVLDVLIPFGISFYTFEAISYAVDVANGKVKAERSLPHFLLFILFFPHLVAGPIVRAGDFLRQAHKVKRWNWVRVQVGVQLILIGLFKKWAIADRMAVFSSPIFEDPAAYNASSLWLATLAYALRIYADFSGYSDMAIGTAHLLGFKLTQNFNMPYLSPNVSEFWRRWHISLSTWLRDYLYIPLGGSRGTRWETHRNQMVTMLLGGLWHGSNWSYVVWGGLHGMMLIVHKEFRDFARPRAGLRGVLESVPGTALRVLVTFFCVMLCWVFFRPELDKSLIMLERMFTFAVDSRLPFPLHNRSLWYTVLFVLLSSLLVATGVWQRVWQRTPAVAAGFAYALVLTAAMVLAPEQGQTFIYFTF